jgi:hypothetical protein
MKKALLGMILLLATPLAFSSLAQESKPAEKTAPPAQSIPAPPQEFPPKKPKYDYMSLFYSRNTKPLGLKEDQALRKLLRQKSVKWALRTRVKHILD